MIYAKMRISKLPFKIKVSFRKSNWYLFPQGWTWQKSVAEISYKADGNIYEHKHFYLTYAYNFAWLFINVYWELDKGVHLSTSTYRHEPIRYVTEDGEMFKQ